MDTTTQQPAPTARPPDHKKRYVDFTLQRAVIDQPMFYSPSEVRNRTPDSHCLFLHLPREVRDRMGITNCGSSAAPKRQFKVIIIEVTD